MEVYKHRNFAKWAKSEGLTDAMLKQAVAEMNNGLFEVNLGSGLYKKRIAVTGKGKRGGFRSLLAFRITEKAIFIYGFRKNERSNISDSEKHIYKALAKEYLDLSNAHINKMLEAKILIEIK